VKTVANETTPEEGTWTDHQVSRQIAEEAGRLLIDLRRSVLSQLMNGGCETRGTHARTR